MTVHDEVEITFQAELDLDLTLVLQHVQRDLPDLRLRAQHEQWDLDATYFDTAALALARAAITLRRRTGGDDAAWHLKLPTPGDTRAEKHVPLSRARTRVPATLRRLVAARCLGAPLVPVARIETQRRAYLLTDSEDTPLLEVADDRVRATRLRISTDSEGEHRDEGSRAEQVDSVQVWREVEVECAGGSPELLDRVATSMRAAGLHDAAGTGRSKLLRTLDPPLAEPAVLRRQSAGGEVVLAYAAEQVEQIRSLDPLVRLDRPTSVHQMRVATRRLRSTLKTFRPVFDTEVTKPLRSELRWLAEHLGRARDAEVLRGRLMSCDGEGLVPDMDLLAMEFAAQRMEATYAAEHACLVQQLDSERYHALVRSLVALVQRPPLTQRAFRPAAEVLPRRAHKAYRAVARSVLALQRCPDETYDEALHEARKAARRARYAAEALAPSLGTGATTFAAAMEHIQEELGEHQDTVMMRSLLHRWAVEESSGARAFAYGRRHAAEEQASQEAQLRFVEAWRLAKKKELRSWLKQAIRR